MNESQTETTSKAGSGPAAGALRDGPLTGLRVIDMTTVGMGPMATQTLGDLGADVIKIEPREGDIFRHVTPQRHPAMSHTYLNLNRNKRSVVIDAKTTQGREALRRLLQSADVFVSNVRPQALRRLGLDAPALLADNPRLIHCTCFGYGEGGPYAGRAGIDDTIQALSGLADLQGGGGDPRFVNSVVADKILALYVSQSIMAALLARATSGRGQAVEVPMFESMVAFMAVEHLAGLSFDPPLGGAGYSRLLNPWRKPFRTRDGFMAVVPYTDPQWRRFFEMAGRPELADEDRYRTLTERSRRFDELYQIVEQALAQRSNAEWEDLLKEADIPFAPVKGLEALLDDEHLRAVGFWQTIEHPSEGRLRMPGIPMRFSETPATIRRHAPQLGEHTEEVLREIGLNPDSAP
ncbi:MAG: CaiB/BaiF CoA transferase family protein [Burkholderiaceae bacterium]